MLLISIVFNGQGRDRKALFLPATIVFGAVTSTIVVLRKSRYYGDKALFLPETLEELKQRIENLEAIVTRDSEHWDQSFKQFDPTTIDRC